MRDLWCQICGRWDCGRHVRPEPMMPLADVIGIVVLVAAFFLAVMGF